MKKEAILHIPLSQYAYATGEKDITIRLRTAKGDLKECQLYYGDRVDQNPVIRMKKKKMTCVSSDDLFDYYEADLKDTYPRLCYYFELEDAMQRQYYYERGFCTRIGNNRTEYFQFPYIRREDIIAPPEWAQNLIMYQIFPDSFATQKGSIVKAVKSIETGNGMISANRMGGTLQGITENMEYIKGLGINCIYLNPILWQTHITNMIHQITI